MIRIGVASPLPSSRRPRDHIGRAALDQAVDLRVERGGIERSRARAQGVGRVEVLHRQGVVAKIVRGLAQGEVNPQALLHFQPRRGEGGFHARNQIGIGRRDGATPDEIVVASRHAAARCVIARVKQSWASSKRPDSASRLPSRSCAMAFGGIERQRPSQHPLGFDVAIFGQQRPRRAEASESASSVPSPPLGGNSRSPLHDGPSCGPRRRRGTTPRSATAAVRSHGRRPRSAEPRSPSFSRAIPMRKYASA